MGNGPLNGVKIIEFAGIGPGLFCAMLLSDMGAEVLRMTAKAQVAVRPMILPAAGASRLRWI